MKKRNEWRFAFGTVAILPIALAFAQGLQVRPEISVSDSSTGCSLEKYKEQTLTIMKGFQDLTRTVDLYGPDIRLNFELQDILDKAKDIAYVYKYPPS